MCFFADAAASPASSPHQHLCCNFAFAHSSFQHDLLKLSAQDFTANLRVRALLPRTVRIDIENLHHEDTDVDQDNIVHQYFKHSVKR